MKQIKILERRGKILHNLLTDVIIVNSNTVYSLLPTKANKTACGLLMVKAHATLKILGN
jgi:hypothetical protein